MMLRSYNLAPTQEGMLFHHIQDPKSGVDLEQLVCSLHESIESDCLLQACREMLARHEVFRTSFQWENLAKPMQVVAAEVSTPFEFVDLSHLPIESAQEQFNRYLETDRTAGFDLTEAPLTRFALFKFNAENYKLVWTIHHTALDGRSFPLILNELFGVYDARRAGTKIELPELRPYADYISWLETADLAKAESFWREYLRGFTLANQVPALDGTDSNESGRGELEIALSEETTAALRNFAAQEGFTVNTVVQGAWALLLGRYSGSADVVFGATRACRNFAPDAASMVGTFINTLPVRVHIDNDLQLVGWLKQLRASQREIREHEHTSLASLQSWSEVPRGAPLFESILVFDNYDLTRKMQSQGGKWTSREVRLRERTNYPLTLYGYADSKLILKLAYDGQRFNAASIRRMLGHLTTILEAMSAGANIALSRLPFLTAQEERQLEDWNRTSVEYSRLPRIHDLIEAQAQQSPEAVALVFRDQSCTYRELDSRANQLARLLGSLGVQPGDRVGVSMERSIEMLVALLATMKAGAAYVPLDPAYPAERIKYVLSDAHVTVILTQEKLRPLVAEFAPTVVALDSESELIATCGNQPVERAFSSESAAYVIYTSGSTGKPKGVMVSHRNVVNFFVGMDQRFGKDGPGVWLAVTSISFDISVLELFWTLSRGFRVVIQEDNFDLPASSAGLSAGAKSIDFSLFYFASDEHQTGDKYRLLLEGAKIADQGGFSAIWTPERHFHAFGGLYANPAITSAALAMITRNLQIRAGSVVVALHDPIRVAEEWAMVDLLSKGRVGMSVASGWHDRDFVFAPANYAERKKIMLRDLEVVRSLWRGESIQRLNGSGKEVSISIYPRPIQPELPIWITSGGDPQTVQLAGDMGANLLTHLLGQSLEDLKTKIGIYRKAFKQSGKAGRGYVSLMLHAFVGKTDEEVEGVVRTPFCNYLKSSVDLMKQVVKGLGEEFSANALSPDDMASLIDHAFHRYFATSGLFGTVDSCLAMVQKLKDIDVDEVACLVDFGIETETVLRSLEDLRELSVRANRSVEMGYSIPEQIFRHRVTHMQCTPSLARMLLANAAGREGLGALHKLLVGGEALPASLAIELQQVSPAEIYNMYGPTETTIWSTMEKLDTPAREVTIGRPIANTTVFVLDASQRPVPVGVPGELYIGGDGVVLGYLNRPELTAERFVRLPFNHERVYRTGDLVKYLPDGRIQFLGRVDHQVKIRGHRIELEEIEAALRQHPTVGDAIVSAVEHQTEGSVLVAYVVKRDQASPQAAELRQFLAAQLPAYMVPGSYAVLEAFPRTPNGKTDRKRLPHPDIIREQKPVVAPRSPVEQKLAAIWREALHVDQVGIHDNFFELGGHSLTAVVVTGKIRMAFASTFPLQAVLDKPTIAQLSDEVERLVAAGGQQKPARPPIVRKARPIPEMPVK